MKRFDVVVVGAGPAGSICAYCLARGGASVALIDRVRFPRDKACGDLLSPRTTQALRGLGIGLEGSVEVGDMQLRGQTGRSLPLPWPRGATYPDRAEALPRFAFDEQLRVAAMEAGAEFIHRNLDQLGLTDGQAVITLADDTKPKLLSSSGQTVR